MGKRNKYEVGEILIARKWVNIHRINIKLRYKIVKIGGKVRLKNICDDRDALELHEEYVHDIFIYSYCATCHSSQLGIGQRKRSHSRMAVKIRYPSMAMDFSYKVRGFQKCELLFEHRF